MLKKYIGIILIITSSCDLNEANKKSKLEIDYSNISDSLIKYKTNIPTDQIDAITIDYMRLSYKVFKEKYKLKDTEFNRLNQTLITTYNIGKTYKSINKNLESISSIDNGISDSLNNNYALKKEDKNKYGPILKNKDERTESEILMDAFEQDEKK